MKWSKLRVNLKSFIIPELRDRIDFHLTCYHDAHDNYGEVWVTVDGEKIFGGGYYHWYVTPLLPELLSTFEIQHGFQGDFYKAKIENKNVEEIMNLGIHETSHITDNLFNYLNTPFEECINSNNPIYKAFSIIDRRLGKRRFKNIQIEDPAHPLVSALYKLRSEV
ncbi:hypothetical protein H1230_06825 [Paenibacillus sp. 19GGS1-52]|uniref:SF0329 family protein n=1 Tax=Paenibacillus sp. 19GGS1-52 TaxID=2758563 RepID=UPI001EFB8F28|nr:hypothetical protein [Paenibacillus sp. 19GGS1-52]ULO08515.1 hypothetical protein H1230_06825 [Paenibacillus sp. 19GGS1-52]